MYKHNKDLLKLFAEIKLVMFHFQQLSILNYS